MTWNPPILRHEIADTLLCIGVDFVYEKKADNSGNPVRCFALDDGSSIEIFSPARMRLNKTKCKSTYELKVALLAHFRNRI